MPMGYQTLKFMQFNGKGNPKQHIAHFFETGNNAGTEGDYLIKQFMRSLKGNATSTPTSNPYHKRARADKYKAMEEWTDRRLH